MHPRTIVTLDELEQADWFAAVGAPASGPVIVVTSWEEAIRYCGSTEWENLTLEASNRNAVSIAKRSRERFNNWNTVVGELKISTIPLVKRKTEKIIQAFNLPNVFLNTVDWDILGVCLEAEYADIFPPGFFASQAYWYVNGRFPCGWSGNFPNGKLVVY